MKLRQKTTMADTTVADLQAILAQQLTETTSEYDDACNGIARLEMEIAEFEDQYRAVFNQHRDLYLRLANARRHEDSLAWQIGDIQRAVEDEVERRGRAS
jgi:hypothetical protein